MKLTERKVFNLGGMDSDSAPDEIAPNDYRDMFNRRHDDSLEGDRGATINIRSTLPVPVPGGLLPSGQVYTTIGYKEDTANDRAIIFKHAVPNNGTDMPAHCILEFLYASRTYNIVLLNGPMTGGVDVLNFDINHKILDIDIQEDLLYWTDNFNDPRKLNISRAKATKAIFFTATGFQGGKTILASTAAFAGLPSGDYSVVFTTPRPRRYTVVSSTSTVLTIKENIQVSGTATDAALYGGYGFFTKDIIKAIKGQPNQAATSEFISNTSLLVNSIIKKLFQFRYRYIYKDNEISPLSCASFRSVIENKYTGNSTDNNGLRIGIQTGSRDVAKIEVYARIGLQDYLLIRTIDKYSDPYYADETTCFIDFYNDGVYSSINTEDQAKIADDAFPYLAKAQAMVNKNYLVYGNITQGDDTVTGGDADATFIPSYRSAFSKSTNSSNIRVELYKHYYYTDGFVQNETNEVHTIGEYYGVAQIGDLQITGKQGSGSPFVINMPTNATRATVHSVLVSGILTYGFTSFENEPTTQPYYVTLFKTTGYNIIAINPVSGTYAGNTMDLTYRQYKLGSKRQYGFQYFDKEGRRIGGVVTKPEWFVNYEYERPTFPGSINNFGVIAGMQFSIQHKPPVNAWFFSLCRTQDLSKQSYLQWVSIATAEEDDTVLIDYSNIFTYQQVNAGQSNVVYTPKDGDRIRLLGDYTTGVYANLSGGQYETDVILTKKLVDGTIVIDEPYKIRFKKPGYTVPALCFFEVYTPQSFQSQSELFFYEYGETFNILNPGTNDRCHDTNLGNKSFGNASDAGIENHGDNYMLLRKIPMVKPKDDGTLPPSITYFDVHCEAPYFSDFFDSGYSDNGRAMVIDNFAGKKVRPVTMVNSRQYVYQTNINGLSAFDDTEFIDLDITYGSIQKLHTTQGALEIYQEKWVADMPINQQQIQDNQGNSQLINSSSVLNRPQYSLFNYGIGKNPESFAYSYNARYFIDVNKGVAIRKAADGMTVISDYKYSRYFTNKCRDFQQSGGTYVYGGYDETNDKYLVSFRIPSANDTVCFSEGSNRWTERYGYDIEFYASMYNEFVSFKNGILYLHDDPEATGFNAFQNQAAANGKIDMVFNDPRTKKKTFHAIWHDALAAVSNWSVSSISTSLGQQSSLLQTDFKRKEGVWHAGLLRDTNTPNVATPLIYGDHLKGKYAELTIECLDNNSKNELYSVALLYISPEM